MTDFTYNQTIEYIDGTRDLNFEIKRRQTFTLLYYGTTPNFFRFIYAEGEN